MGVVNCGGEIYAAIRQNGDGAYNWHSSGTKYQGGNLERKNHCSYCKGGPDPWTVQRTRLLWGKQHEGGKLRI
eukprot:8242398-Ditylum_brightwellii.AAC.1